MPISLTATSKTGASMPAEGLAFDEIVEQALSLCSRLPETEFFKRQSDLLADLSERLAGGRLHLAVLGQFNRGKSSFVNALLGVPVLPVSVLPITTVPTIIVYGARLSCTIEFTVGKEPVRAFDETEKIAEVLRRYVAEDMNPQNERGVSRVTLTCTSDILKHGTMLIDTPGFGSTHVHNTETARKLVEGCDAALFLLSADLPITQVEVDFLTEVRKYVPRVFFVYNKIDLLSDDERAATSKFIADVITRSLKLTDTPRLFPISARAGMEAQRHEPGDERWRSSGMESIQTEIIDFLLREKYFALSEALSEKCGLALDAIIAALEQMLSSIRAPIVELEQKLAEAQVYINDAQRNIDAEMGMMPHEEKALFRQLDEILAARKDTLHRTIDDTLEPLLSAASLRHGNHDVIYSSAKKLFDEMFAHMFAQITSTLNTSLRRNQSAHQKKLDRLCREISNTVGCHAGAETDGVQTMADIQLDVSPGWRPSVTFDEPHIPFSQSIADRFLTPRQRFQAYRKKILPLLHEYGNHCLQDLANTARNRIHAAYASLSETLFKYYSIQIARLLHWQADQQKVHAEQTAVSTPDIDRIEELLRRFSTLRAALV